MGNIYSSTEGTAVGSDTLGKKYINNTLLMVYNTLSRVVVEDDALGIKCINNALGDGG
jgi:hypothetical protein